MGSQQESGYAGLKRVGLAVICVMVLLGLIDVPVGL